MAANVLDKALSQYQFRNAALRALTPGAKACGRLWVTVDDGAGSSAIPCCAASNL